MILLSRFRLKVALFFYILIGSTFVALSEEQPKQPWSAPVAEAQKKNPVAATESSLAAGQKIYSKICAMCHGKTGDADGPAVIELNIHPAKLSDPKLAMESDGSLFWKVTTGKKPMPAFGRRFSETDRWNLVNYIRTLPSDKRTAY
jgi:mono/diheme cytochrome c family protein